MKFIVSVFFTHSSKTFPIRFIDWAMFCFDIFPIQLERCLKKNVVGTMRMSKVEAFFVALRPSDTIEKDFSHRRTRCSNSSPHLNRSIDRTRFSTILEELTGNRCEVRGKFLLSQWKISFRTRRIIGRSDRNEREEKVNEDYFEVHSPFVFIRFRNDCWWSRCTVLKRRPMKPWKWARSIRVHYLEHLNVVSRTETNS